MPRGMLVPHGPAERHAGAARPGAFLVAGDLNIDIINGPKLAGKHHVLYLKQPEAT